jgi:ornithine cyclodeaminase/alanine dehydrogenase-like protein (mu-crystallin family)
MALIVSNEDAEQVLDMKGAIAALEPLYRDLGRASAVNRPRSDLFTPTAAEVGADVGADVPSAHQFKTLDGAIPRLRAASIRVTSDVVAFPVVNGSRRRVKIPAAAGKRYVGLVFLFSTATGELVAVVQDGMLQKFTVGAINAIGAKYLAREDASVVGLIGAGNQAGPQLAALKEVRPIRQVRVYSPTEGEAAAFAKAQGAALGLEIAPAASAEAAVAGADIAVTATNSRQPFFPARWLAPGMHLSSMQRDEAMDDCFTAADIVVFHTRLKEREVASADFAAMEAKHRFTIRDHPERALDWDKFPDLGELVAGKVAGRTRPDQRTFFLNSTGIGCQFTALAHFITTQARERGLGHEVPGEMFTEALQP